MKLTYTTLKRMLDKHQLARIEMVMSRRGFTAVAYPQSFHPIVQTRRDAMLQKMHDEGITSIGLMSPEADRLHDAVTSAIARGTADSIEAAMDALSQALKAPLS